MKKKLLICTLTAALLTGQIVGATQITDVSFKNQTLTVSGDADGSGKVTLRVLKPGVKAEDLGGMSIAEQMDSTVYLRQADSGEFTFVYSPKTISEWGNYNIYVTDSNGETKYEYKLMADSATSAALLAALNAAGTKDAMKAVFTSYPQFISGITTVDEIKQKYTADEVTDAVAEMMAGLTYSDADDAVKEAVKAAIVTDISKSANAQEAVDAIKTYAKELGLADNSVYNDLYLPGGDETYAKSISASFIKSYSKTSAFLNDFNTVIILDKLNTKGAYTKNESILAAGSEFLTKAGFNYTDYNALTAKSYVWQKLAERSNYATIEDVKTVFNAAVSEAKGGKKNTNTSNGGSSGGSSSSSSSGNSSQIGVSKISEPTGDSFTDLSSAEWAKESILALYNKGIVSGTEKGKFDPQGLVTREQFAKMIITACGLYNANATCSFDDIQSGAWFESYVASAVDSGIVFGTSDNSFGTGMQITRQDMAVMAYRAATKTGISLSQADGAAFADDGEISDYAKDAVYTLKASSVMSGKGDNNFEPKAYATRAEAAKMIHSLISR